MRTLGRSKTPPQPLPSSSRVPRLTCEAISAARGEGEGLNPAPPSLPGKGVGGLGSAARGSHAMYPALLLLAAVPAAPPVPVTDLKLPPGFTARFYADNPIAPDVYAMTI